MNKVLIIGPDYYYFNESVAKAFRELGWEAKVEAFATLFILIHGGINFVINFIWTN